MSSPAGLFCIRTRWSAPPPGGERTLVSVVLVGCWTVETVSVAERSVDIPVGGKMHRSGTANTALAVAERGAVSGDHVAV